MLTEPTAPYRLALQNSEAHHKDDHQMDECSSVESSGNPVDRTYWRWRWSFNPFAIYQSR
jgi:hypothetical protein